MSTEANGAETPLSFKDLALPEPVRKAIADKGYDSPTPVQHEAFAPGVAGKDLVVQARTGTGKTTAFGLPLVAGRVRATEKRPQALILCPTRELALQVMRELESLAKYTELKVCAVYGGAPMGKQVEDLQESAQIVVGTPGRVLDHLKRKTFDPSALRTFVLDECDEMLSMGFLPQITDIWQRLPAGHQTMLFSATIPPEVSRIADTRLREPHFITLSGDHIGALEIDHYFYLSQGDKGRELLKVLELEQPESAIIFCNTRDETKRVTKLLKSHDYEADWLNADLNQNERETVMARVREGKQRFLVCTDVAARGIDISHLTHVINFDFPESAEQYVHRTGRTGRAGKTGTAIAFVEPGSIGDLYYLRLRYKIQPIERYLPSAQELRTREEADVVSLLAVKFAGIDAKDSFFGLARRLLTHDQAESIVAGLLKEHLGTREAAAEGVSGARKDAQLTSPRKARVRTELTVDSKETERGRRDDDRQRRPARNPRPPDVRLRGERDDRGRRSAEDCGELSSGAAAGSTPKDDAEEPTRAAVATVGGAVRQDGGTSSRLPRDADRVGRQKLPQRQRVPQTERFEQDGFSYKVSDAPAPQSSTAVETAGEIVQSPRPPRPNDGEFVNLYINVGRRDGASTSDLQNALETAGIGSEATGRLSIRQRHSFLEVRSSEQEAVIAKLTGTEVCGRAMHLEVARPRDAD